MIEAIAEQSSRMQPASRTLRCGFVESYPHVIAGQQRTMLSLLETWQDYGERVLLTPAEGVFVDEARRRGVETHIVPYGRQLGRYSGAIYNDGLIARARTYWELLGYVGRARRFLKHHRFDALFCNDMRGVLTLGVAAKSLGVPVMIWDKLDKPHGFLDWFQLPLVRKNPVISAAVTTKYPRWQRSYYRDRIVVVPNGADLARFDSVTPMREDLGLTPQEFVVGIVGTVTHRKGIDRLLSIVPELAREVPNLRILVVGSWDDSTEDTEYYEHLPNRNHPCVSFLGYRKDADRIMKSLDVLVIPSRHEGMGQVTAEAMACSVPVVGARSGGIPEVVDDGVTGMIFDGENRELLRQHLTTLATSPELRRGMGTQGRERAQAHFNRPRQMQAICEILAQLAHERSGLSRSAPTASPPVP